jgi:ferredoxin-NADP reductase
MFTETALRRLVGVADEWLTPHGIDRYVELVAPRFSTTEVRARVVAVDRPTADTVALTLAPNRRWTSFLAGQHTLLTVEIDGVRHTRCYSMSSSAHRRDGRIELTVKAHPHGTVSRHLVDRARVGLVVGLSPPQGSFTLPDPRPGRLLLISGGSGITPVLSMLRTLCDEDHRGAVTFLHYCLTARDLIAADELRDIAARFPDVRVVRVFTDEPGAGDLDGFFSAAQLARADPLWAEAQAFVCGPAPLMDAVGEHYAAAGLADRLEREAFTLSQVVGEAGTVGGTLRFHRSDVEIDSDGSPLLEQAERAGLRPDHGCRMGICHTCTRRLSCGTVRNVVTGEMTTEADVDVRLCVNAPVGDVTIDL